MRGPKALFEAENKLVTDMGAWFPGERVVFRGKDLHHDLADLSWMELYLFGITGRRFEVKELKLFNALWVLTSYPDPRLWNNRVVALAMTVRSTAALGIAAAIAVSEAEVYGAMPEMRAHAFLNSVPEDITDSELLDMSISEMRARRSLAGFGRPIARVDERISVLSATVKDVGAEQHRCWRTAFKIEHLLNKAGYHDKLNYAGASAAVAVDLGLSTQEFYHFAILAFVGGMMPLLHASSRPVGTFFPLRSSALSAADPYVRDVRPWA